jgi:DNA-binding GntR family transcriptional regulator
MLSAQIAIVNRISARAPKHFDDSTQSHLELVRLIRKRDCDAAKRCLEIHLTEVRNKTLEEYAIHKDRRI